MTQSIHEVAAELRLDVAEEVLSTAEDIERRDAEIAAAFAEAWGGTAKPPVVDHQPDTPRERQLHILSLNLSAEQCLGHTVLPFVAEL